jgi:hypothetical protein
VLSAVGATRRPQSGQFIDAVAESGLDMPKQRAMNMPRWYGITRARIEPTGGQAKGIYTTV